MQERKRKEKKLEIGAAFKLVFAFLSCIPAFLGSVLKSRIQPMRLHDGMEAIGDATTRTIG